MADSRGECSNHWDEFFKELETWEAVLTALPDYPVDGGDPPG